MLELVYRAVLETVICRFESYLGYKNKVTLRTYRYLPRNPQELRPRVGLLTER